MLKGNIDYRKVKGKHTSATPYAKDVVLIAQKHYSVTAITLGPIEAGIGSKRPRLRFKITHTGLRVEALSTNSMQVIYIHTKDPEAVQDKLVQQK